MRWIDFEVRYALLFCWMGFVGMEQISAQDESDAGRGHLVIIGGALRPDNRPVFETFINYAGGADKARLVILPTASSTLRGSLEFCQELQTYGISPERAEVLDVMVHNAKTATAEPRVLEKVRQATGVFISGGDQRRLVRLLTNGDGSDTPLLAEIRALLARGGVIAGTSAGASVQSETMLAVSGLPNMLFDEGLDALDYGITSDSAKRGLLITRGFGFFKAGIIDQHFYFFRGRLGRLTRAVDECGAAYGFGIDEDTALIVEPSGRCRVLGAGFVTIIQPPEQRGEDGPLGYRVHDVRLSVLSDGDTFDPTSQQITVAPEKPVQPVEKAEYNGNFLINDIGANGAGHLALITGLAENQKPRQDAIAIKFHGDTSHGYRFVFSKRQSTRSYVGKMNGSWTYSLLDLRLDIDPIANGLRPSATQVATDLPDDERRRRALSGVAFRGLLTNSSAMHFRPLDPITRGELAYALARSAHLYATSPDRTKIADIDWTTLDGEEIYQVVAAGMMSVDNHDMFRADEKAEASEVAIGLRKLALLDRKVLDEDLTEKLATLEANADRETSRETVGLLLHAILELPE